MNEAATELTMAIEQLAAARKELKHIQDMIVQGEQAFGNRSTELRTILADLQKRVRQLGEQAREYEAGMRYTREEDVKRKAALDAHETDLKARERRLFQDNADFEKRKRRFQQLKDQSQ